MTLRRQDLEDISARTLDHYNRRAEDFWNGTRDHDVSQNIAALLRYIEGEPPFAILDLGCGPGRDLKRSEEHTSELQSQSNLVCRLLLEKKKQPRTRVDVPGR